MYLAHLKRPTLPKATIAPFSMLSSRPISHSHPSFVLSSVRVPCRSVTGLHWGATQLHSLASIIHSRTQIIPTHRSEEFAPAPSGVRFLCVYLSPSSRVDAFYLFPSPLPSSSPPRDSAGIRLRTISEWRTFLDDETITR